MRRGKWRGERGMTLIELLCVIAILAILASLYLGTMTHAFVHLKKVLLH